MNRQNMGHGDRARRRSVDELGRGGGCGTADRLRSTRVRVPVPDDQRPPVRGTVGDRERGHSANIVTWLLIGVARHRLALVGGGLAILGYLVRIAISVAIEARPDASVDGPIVISILLMFAGLAGLGVATLRAGRLSGWSARAPPVVLAVTLSLRRSTRSIRLFTSSCSGCCGEQPGCSWRGSAAGSLPDAPTPKPRHRWRRRHVSLVRLGMGAASPDTAHG